MIIGNFVFLKSSRKNLYLPLISRKRCNLASRKKSEFWSSNRVGGDSVWEHDGLLVIIGRAEAGLKKYFGVHYLPVIMANTSNAKLIMLWAHCKDHANRDTTLFTATQVAWVVGGREVAGKISNVPEQIFKIQNAK